MTWRELNLVCVGVSVSLTVCAAISAIPLCLASDVFGRLPILLLSSGTSNTSSGITLRPPPFRQAVSLALRSLSSKPAIYLVPATTLASPLAGTEGATVLRLMPVRFSWSLQSSSLLLASQSAVTFAVLVVVLPAAAHVLGKAPSLSAASSSSAAAARDRILLRASVSFLALGPALMAMISSPALATGAIISAWGLGVPTLARALLITVLPGLEHVGSVFGILAVGEILGTLACDIISGALFDLGLRTWIGLPFIFAVVTSALILLTVWQVPGPNRSPEVDATLEETKDQ
ncbi:hypothetical protein N3K66_004444 [Trichothecium roseum]|uniref:Uncharacterized protein n=1 Tax=Trichothecium roseum TaxID=47278 RepID=A0ACC0V1M7_9HYPO|nr:hypothetical protein N3K66_004444 [Trichothecium roseum]